MSKRWGTPTWYFLHCIVEKINVNYYNKIHGEVRNLIINIFQNLPCPYCKNHALNYIKKKNIYKIKTKEEMKMYLFNFHNEVNKRLNHRIQEKSILDMYKKMNFVKVYNYFDKEFFYSNPLQKTFFSWQSTLSRDVIEFLNKHRGQMRV
tara:strand:- start:10637 stop:11083 length:447 start_codon:yes stop_codon:yes gene_type:complete